MYLYKFILHVILFFFFYILYISGLIYAYGKRKENKISEISFPYNACVCVFVFFLTIQKKKDSCF